VMCFLQALADGLWRLAHDKKLCAQYVKKGLALANDNSVNSGVQRMVDVWRSLKEGRQSEFAQTSGVLPSQIHWSLRCECVSSFLCG